MGEKETDESYIGLLFLTETLMYLRAIIASFGAEKESAVVYADDIIHKEE